MSNNSRNLNTLIQQAENAIRQQKSGRAQTRYSEQRYFSGAVFTSSLAFFLWGWLLWASSVSTSQIRADLAVLVNAARVQVEQATRQQGRLPSQLPDAALARVVRYEIEDADAKPPKYSLSAEIRGVSERWSSR